MLPKKLKSWYLCDGEAFEVEAVLADVAVLGVDGQLALPGLEAVGGRLLGRELRHPHLGCLVTASVDLMGEEIR